MSDETTVDEAMNMEMAMQTPPGEAGVPLEDFDAPQKDYNEGDGVEEARTAADLEAVFDVPVRVSAVLGKTRMEVNDLLRIGEGTVLELDRKIGEAIDIFVNNRLVARGEVVLVGDKLGVTMTEIIKGNRD